MPEREREGKVGPANQEAIQNNKYSYASRVVKFNSKRFMWLEIQEHASGGRHINPQQHATATNLFDQEKCIYNYCKDCRLCQTSSIAETITILDNKFVPVNNNKWMYTASARGTHLKKVYFYK